jgi:Mn-dependent DtxR family transcriptional regulator
MNFLMRWLGYPERTTKQEADAASHALRLQVEEHKRRADAAICVAEDALNLVSKGDEKEHERR